MTLDAHGKSNSNPLAHWPRPLAFVLSGGGAYGSTQVGMINAVLETGIKPDMVVGTSVGALNGAMLAADVDGAVDRLTEVWLSMDRRGVFGGRNRFTSAVSALRNGLKTSSKALAAPDVLESLIRETLTVERIEELPITTGVVATDALVGMPKLLSMGQLTPALLASAAIPGVFPPVKIDGGMYIDGGVSANVPIRQAIAFGARSVIVLNANPGSMPGTLPTSLIGSAVHASQIMLRNQRADAVEDLVGKYPILTVPQSTPPTQSSFDFSNAGQLIEIGTDVTRGFLRRLPELTDSSPAPEADDMPEVELPPPPAPRPAPEGSTSRIAG